MPALHTYAVNMDGADVSCITRDDLTIVRWSDADFQMWNAARQTPYVLSQRQQLIQQIKALTLAQWQDGTVTQAQKDKMKNAFAQEIV